MNKRPATLILAVVLAAQGCNVSVALSRLGQNEGVHHGTESLAHR